MKIHSLEVIEAFFYTFQVEMETYYLEGDVKMIIEDSMNIKQLHPISIDLL